MMAHAYKAKRINKRQRAPLARLNSPTLGQVKFPQAGQSRL
jgi:hypothetical protein